MSRMKKITTIVLMMITVIAISLGISIVVAGNMNDNGYITNILNTRNW